MQPRGKRKSKTARRSRIAQTERSDLRQRIERQAALQRRIEIADAGGKKPRLRQRPTRQGLTRRNLIRQRLRNACRSYGQPGRRHLMRRRGQCRHRPAFQSGNGFTQGKKRFPRHGGLSHDVSSRSIMFSLCSYGFQRPEKESTPFYEKIFLCPCPGNLRPVQAGIRIRSKIKQIEPDAVRKPLKYFSAPCANPLS